MPADHTAAPSTPTRLLLVANRTCPCPALPAQVIEHVGDADAEVLVVARLPVNHIVSPDAPVASPAA